MSKEETVEVTLKLPKAIVDFLKDMQTTLNMTVEEYLVFSIIQAVGADLDTNDVFVPSPAELVERYGLKTALLKCNGLPYMDC